MTNFCYGIADLNQTPRRCVMERAHRMLGYNCARLELKDIPKSLKTSTEVNKKWTKHQDTSRVWSSR
jgi:hypothetical protein